MDKFKPVYLRFFCGAGQLLHLCYVHSNWTKSTYAFWCHNIYACLHADE